MYRIGIDVGGTFTDVFLIDEATGTTTITKILNEPGRRAQTVVRGIRRVIDMARISAGDVRFIGHGTTITTNAVLEHKGAPTALVTNKGFRDVIEIGRFSRPAELIYRVQMDKPPPLVPRHLRLEVDCRVDAAGEIIRDLQKSDLDQVITAIRASQARAVAVSLLFSFLEPSHEQQIREAITAALPDVDVLLSSEVQPEFREYPRTSTTIFAAYISPIFREYLETLLRELKETALASPLFIFQSNGGVSQPSVVLRNPVTTLLSGPAGAVVGTAYLSKVCGYPRLITMDMGGTSLDVCLLRDGVAETTTTREIDYYPISTPMLDVHTVGAGGGSIVRVDEVGRLRIGPESAAADPGPACYGLGGRDVTLTDVNLVLGYLDPDDFAGGEVKLNPNLARAAIREKIAQPLGLDIEEAAIGIFAVAVSQIAEAIRFVSIQRGSDPRDFDLFAFGGGGPIHACSVAKELGMSRVIVPPNPGLFSASGIAVANFTHHYSVSILKHVAQIENSAIHSAFNLLLDRARSDLDAEGVPLDRQRFERSLDLRYVGQTTEINVHTNADDWRKPLDMDQFVQEFHIQHHAIYTYSVPSEPVEIVNIRVKAVGIVDKPRLNAMSRDPSRDRQRTSVRKVWFSPRAGYQATKIFWRDDLGEGLSIAGPAIIQELSSATVVPPGSTANFDAAGNILLFPNRPSV
jgi:N-methylhydantoinase A